MSHGRASRFNLWTFGPPGPGAHRAGRPPGSAEHTEDGMRIPLFTALGALATATGLAAAQPPAPGPMPAGPMPGQPTTPGSAAVTEPAAAPPAVLATPAPLPPAAAAPVANGVPYSPVAAFQGMPPGWSPGAPVSDLAHWYNVPVKGPQAWVGAELLLWQVRQGPLPTPLVNTTIVPVDLAGTITTGSIVDPNAVTILGNQRIGFDTFTGVRATAGRWLDCCQELGVETTFFILPERGREIAFAGGTGPNATPALTVPFNSVAGGFVGETSTTIAGPFAGATVTGNVGLTMNSRLWGGDGDMLLNLAKGEYWRVDGIVGFKYLSLHEDLEFRTNLTSAPGGGTFDQFQVRNHFYGGEIGARSTGRMNKLGAELTTKVALGDTAREVQIRGSSALPNNLGGGVAPGGLFALSSNIGRSTTDKFSVVPQVNGKLSYDWTCHFRTTAGYNFLYWTDVIRPGNVIDRNINPNLAPVFGGGPGGVGLALPQRRNVDSDFFAHGVSIGVELMW
jgi:hypothetical protein